MRSECLLSTFQSASPTSWDCVLRLLQSCCGSNFDEFDSPEAERFKAQRLCVNACPCLQVAKQLQEVEQQQQRQQQEETDVYEQLAQQSCCCEIAYQDLLQQTSRFATAIQNKQKLEAAALLAAAEDPAANAEGIVPALTETVSDGRNGPVRAFIAAAADAEQEEALQALLTAADRGKVRAAIQYWTREAAT